MTSSRSRMIWGSANRDFTARSVAIKRPLRSTMSGLAQALTDALCGASANVTRNRALPCSARCTSCAATTAKETSSTVSVSSARTCRPIVTSRRAACAPLAPKPETMRSAGCIWLPLRGGGRRTLGDSGGARADAQILARADRGQTERAGQGLDPLGARKVRVLALEPCNLALQAVDGALQALHAGFQAARVILQDVEGEGAGEGEKEQDEVKRAMHD